MLVLTQGTCVLKLFCSELMFQAALCGKIYRIFFKKKHDKNPNPKKAAVNKAGSEFEQDMPSIPFSFFLPF